MATESLLKTDPIQADRQLCFAERTSLSTVQTLGILWEMIKPILFMLKLPNYHTLRFPRSQILWPALSVPSYLLEKTFPRKIESRLIVIFVSIWLQKIISITSHFTSKDKKKKNSFKSLKYRLSYTLHPFLWIIRAVQTFVSPEFPKWF